MSTQSAKKKRLGSRRRVTNQNKTSEADEFLVTDSTSVAQHSIPEENKKSVNEFAYTDNLVSQTQNPPSPELRGNRRKLGSSRRNKGGRHVEDSATDTQHKLREEVEEKKARGNESPETTQVSLAFKPEEEGNLSKGYEHDVSWIQESLSYLSEEEHPSVYSVKGKESENTEVLTQDGNLQSNSLVSESNVESATQLSAPPVETTATKSSTNEHTEIEYELRQETFSSPNEEEHEILNLSRVKDAQHSDDDASNFIEEAMKKTQMYGIHDDNEHLSLEINDTDNLLDQVEFTLKSTDDDSTKQKGSIPDDKNDEQHNKKNVFEAFDNMTEGNYVYDAEKPPTSDTDRPSLQLSHSEIETPFDSLLQVSFVTKGEHNDTDFSPTGRRRKLGSSYENKQGQQMEDSDGESCCKPTEEVEENTFGIKELETQVSLPIEIAMPEKSVEIGLEEITNFDTCQSGKLNNQVKENLHVFVISDESSPQEHSENEWSVEKATCPSPKEELSTIEERREMFTLSDVKNAHQTEDAVNTAHDPEVKTTQSHEIEEIHPSSEDLIHDVTDYSDFFSGHLINQDEVIEQFGSTVKITDDSVTKQEHSNPDDTKEKHHTEESNLGAFDCRNEDYNEGPQIGDKEKVDTALGQVYEIEGRVENDMKLISEQTDHLEKNGLFIEMEESKSFQTMQSDIQVSLNSQPLQNNPTTAEPYHRYTEEDMEMTKDYESLETTMVETDMEDNPIETTLTEIDMFDNDQTEEVSSQVKHNADVGTLIDVSEQTSSNLHLSSTVDQKLAVQSSLEMSDKELHNLYCLTEKEKSDMETKLLRPDVNLQGNYLVDESCLKSEENDFSFVPKITTENHRPPGDTEPECSIKHGEFSSQKIDVEQTHKQGIHNSSERVTDDDTENSAILSGHPTDQVSDTFREDTSPGQANKTEGHVEDEIKPCFGQTGYQEKEALFFWDEDSESSLQTLPAEMPAPNSQEQQIDWKLGKDSSAESYNRHTEEVVQETGDNKQVETTKIPLTGETAEQEKMDTILTEMQPIDTAQTKEVCDQDKTNDHVSSIVDELNSLSLHSTLTVDEQPVGQSNVMEMPGEKCTQVVCSVSEKENTERDTEKDFFRQDGNIQGNYEMSQSAFTQEIPTEKDQPGDNPDNESVEQEESTELSSNEEEKEPLSQVSVGHHLGGTVIEKNSAILSGHPTDQVSDTYPLELIVKSTEFANMHKNPDPDYNVLHHAEEGILPDVQEHKLSLKNPPLDVIAPLDNPFQDYSNSSKEQTQTQTDSNLIKKRKKMGSSRRYKDRQQAKDSVEHKEDVNEEMVTSQMVLVTERATQEELHQGSYYDTTISETHDDPMLSGILDYEAQSSTKSNYPETNLESVLPGSESRQADHVERERHFRVEDSNKSMLVNLEGMDKSVFLNNEDAKGAHHSEDDLKEEHENNVKLTQMQEMQEIDSITESVLHDSSKNVEIISGNLIKEAEIRNIYESELTVKSIDDSLSKQEDLHPLDKLEENPIKYVKVEALELAKNDDHVNDSKKPEQISNAFREDTSPGQANKTEGHVEDEIKSCFGQTGYQEKEGLFFWDEDSESSSQTLPAEMPAPNSQEQQIDWKLGKDSPAESYNRHMEEVVQETGDNKQVETTKITLTGETAEQEKMDTILKEMQPIDTAQTKEVCDQDKTNDHVSSIVDELNSLSLHSTLTVDEQPVGQSNVMEMPGEKCMQVVCSVSEKENTERDTEKDFFRQDGNIQGNYEMSQSAFTQEIPTEKDQPGDNPDNESVEQEESTELSSNEEEKEPLSQVSVGHHLGGTVNEKNSAILSGHPTDQVSDTYPLELIVKSTEFANMHKNPDPDYNVLHHAEEGILPDVQEHKLSLKNPPLDVIAPLDNPFQDYSNSSKEQTQTQTDSNLIKKRKKMGSSRRYKDRQQAKDSVEHKEDVNEEMVTSQMVLVTERATQEELHQGSYYDTTISETHDDPMLSGILDYEAQSSTKSNYPETNLESVLPGSESHQADHVQKEALFFWDEDSESSLQTLPAEMPAPNSQEQQIDWKLGKDSPAESYNRHMEEVVQETGDNKQVETTKIPLTGETAEQERGTEKDFFRQDGNIQGNYEMNQSAFTQEIPTEKDQPGDNPDNESVEQEESTELSSNEEEKEPLSQVSVGHHLGGTVNEIHEEEVKPTQVEEVHQHIYCSVEESDSSLHALQSETNVSSDSELQQINPIGNSSCHRNRERQHVKNTVTDTFYEPKEENLSQLTEFDKTDLTLSPKELGLKDGLDIENTPCHDDIVFTGSSNPLEQEDDYHNQNKEALSCDKEEKKDMQKTNDAVETVGDVTIDNHNREASTAAGSVSEKDEVDGKLKDPMKTDQQAQDNMASQDITESEFFAKHKTDSLVPLDTGLVANSKAEQAVDVAEEIGSDHLQEQSKQRKRKFGSNRRTLHKVNPEGGQENKDETKRVEFKTEPEVRDFEKEEVMDEFPALATAEVSMNEKAKPSLSLVCIPQSKTDETNSVLDLGQMLQSRYSDPKALESSTIPDKNLLLSSNTEECTNIGITGGSFVSLDETQGSQNDEERPESANALQQQALKSTEKQVVAVEDLEIVKAVVIGGEEEQNSVKPSIQESSNVEEGAQKTDLEMKNASPNLNSTQPRRKMGSTRKNLRSKTKDEELPQKQEVDDKAIETTTNAEDVTTNFVSGIQEEELKLPVEQEDSDSVQKKDRVLETVEYSHTSESHLTPKAHQTSEENPVSSSESEHQQAPNYHPVIPSTTSKEDVMSESAAGGRKRKMGSNRKSRGQQKNREETASEDHIINKENGSDGGSVTDESAIKTVEEELLGLHETSGIEKTNKKESPNSRTSKAGEDTKPVSEKKPEQQTPVQRPSADIRLGQEGHQTFSLAGDSSVNRSNSYNVVMVGDSSVGKTSFMKRAQSGKFSLEIPASIGLDSCLWTVVVDGKPVVLRLWDTAGQERFHSITRQIFHKAQAFLLMYDITSAYSFSAVSYWASCIQEGAPENVTVLLLGNKSDHAERQVKTREGETLAKEYNFEFMECSAATGENVIESLETMARMLSQQIGTREEATVSFKEPQKKKSSGCC